MRRGNGLPLDSRHPATRLDPILKKPQLSGAEMKDAKKFREEGETLHQAGKHQESVDALAKAMKILKI